MAETPNAPVAERPEPREHVQEALAEVTGLLRKNRLVEGLIHDQFGDAPDAARDELAQSPVARQNRAELERVLARLHAADIAYVLEALPLDERLYLWDLVKADRDGEILVEVSDAVRESLISSMDTEELVAATEALPADEIAAIADDLPQEVIDDVFESLPVEEREQLRAAMSFDEDMVGAWMDFDDVQVRSDVTLEVVLRYLRRFDELPVQTDQVFVVDRDERLQGVAGARAADRQRPGGARRRRDAAADRTPATARARRDGRRRLRALRPRVGARRRRGRQAGRSCHRRRGA